MDDKTAISTDVDATAVTPNKRKASSSFFSMFDQNNGNNGRVNKTNANTGKLKYMRNVIDEASVEDDPAFAKERAKYGKTPVTKKQKNGNTKKMITILAIAAVLALAIAVGGTIYMSSPQRLEKLLSLGDKYLAELDYENALLAFEKALEINPENERAYIGITKSYMGLGRYDDALETVEKAISLLGKNDELIELRRRIFIAKCGKEGLYLDNGSFVSPGESIMSADVKDAFLYYGASAPVKFSGTVKDDYSEPVINGLLTKLTIDADVIYPLDGNTFAEDIVQNHFSKNIKSCVLVFQVYRDVNSDEFTEDRYIVINPDYNETAEDISKADDVSEEAVDEAEEAGATRKIFDDFVSGKIKATIFDEEESYSDLTTYGEIEETEYKDVDNDGEEEFLIYSFTQFYPVLALDVENGKIKDLCSGNGTAEMLSFHDVDGVVLACFSDTGHVGRQYYRFVQYKGPNIVDEFELSAEYWESERDEYDENSDFTFKGQKITMQEFEKLRKKYTGY